MPLYQGLPIFKSKSLPILNHILSLKTLGFLFNPQALCNMCPLDPKELAERLSCEKFKEVTQRRAQTEARVGILKNNFMGKKLRVHGFAAQERHVAWAVLTHNLWVLARFPYHDLMREDAA